MTDAKKKNIAGASNRAGNLSTVIEVLQQLQNPKILNTIDSARIRTVDSNDCQKNIQIF